MPMTSLKLPPDALEDETSTVVLDQVTHGYVLLDEAIIELADAGRLASVAALLAERTGLLPDTIVRALQELLRLFAGRDVHAQANDLRRLPTAVPDYCSSAFHPVDFIVR